MLVVHGAEDRHTRQGEARRVFERVRTPKWLYAVPGAAHVDLHRHAGKAYEARLAEFFARLQRPPP